jgi:Flp pilus assembly pilin Flp
LIPFFDSVVDDVSAISATIVPICAQLRIASEIFVDDKTPWRGQSLAEYALIVALIVIVALVALTLFGTQINDFLSVIANQING